MPAGTVQVCAPPVYGNVTVTGAAEAGTTPKVIAPAVMSIAPVPRTIASATYGFVRFIGGGLAPFVAGLLVAAVNVHLPFWIAAVVVLAGVVLLSTVHQALSAADSDVEHRDAEAEQAVREVPAVEEEAILAEEAVQHERRAL